MQFRKYGVKQLQNIVITQGQMCGECLHSWTCLSLFFGDGYFENYVPDKSSLLFFAVYILFRNI